MSSSETSSQDVMPRAVCRIDLVSYLEYEVSGRRCLLLVSGLSPLSGESLVIRYASSVCYCPYSRLSQRTVNGRFGCVASHIVWLWLCLRIGVMCQLKLCGGNNYAGDPTGFQIVLRSHEALFQSRWKFTADKEHF